MIMRKKQRKVVGLAAFITITVVFTIVSLMLLYLLQGQAKQNTQTNRLLQEEKLKSEALKIQLDEIQQQNDKQIEDLKEQIEELQLEVISRNEAKVDTQKVAYLTFDDGPSDNTIAILDFLKDYDIKATFFVTGNTNKVDIYKRIVSEGHTLGNHTYGHNYSEIYQSVDNFFADVNKLDDLLEKVTGERTKIIRFPGGSNNTISRRAGGKDIMNTITAKAKEEGYRYFDWNVDSQDAAKGNQSKDVIVKSVMGGAQYSNHAVILMHDTQAKKSTVAALPEIITGLQKQGFIFKPITMDTPEVQF